MSYLGYLFVMCSWWFHERWWWLFWKSNILSFWFWWGIGYVPSLDDAIQGVDVHDIFEKYDNFNGTFL